MAFYIHVTDGIVDSELMSSGPAPDGMIDVTGESAFQGMGSLLGRKRNAKNDYAPLVIPPPSIPPEVSRVDGLIQVLSVRLDVPLETLKAEIQAASDKSVGGDIDPIDPVIEPVNVIRRTAAGRMPAAKTRHSKRKK